MGKNPYFHIHLQLTNKLLNKRKQNNINITQNSKEITKHYVIFLLFQQRLKKIYIKG